MTLVKVKSVTPPRGWRLFLFRLPIWLYRFRFGWLFGRRLLLLYHTGRKSGQIHATVLEVIRYDKANHTYFLASGFGENSDWLKNVMATPAARVMVGIWPHNVVATRLEPAEAAEELLKYWRHKPLLFKYMIIPLLGYKGDPSEKDVRALAEHVPIFSLTACAVTR